MMHDVHEAMQFVRLEGENPFVVAERETRQRGRLDVREAMREVRLALLEADVSYKVVKEFVATVTERSVGTDVLDSLTPAQQVVKIVNEELCNLMGNENARIQFPSKPPCVIMMCGLQGSGKTTHSAKLAKMLKKEGHYPLLVACDIYRPAAIKQLETLANDIGVDFFPSDASQKPIAIATADRKSVV